MPTRDGGDARATTETDAARGGAMIALADQTAPAAVAREPGPAGEVRAVPFAPTLQMAVDLICQTNRNVLVAEARTVPRGRPASVVGVRIPGR